MKLFKVTAHINNIEIFVEANDLKSAMRAVNETNACINVDRKLNTSKLGNITNTDYKPMEISFISLIATEDKVITIVQ